MKTPAIALLSGLVFGFGLVLSGMADSQKVLAFLRLGQGWDPSLMLVMGGALAVTLPGFVLLETRGSPFLAAVFTQPPKWPLDRRLLIGAALFGAGWGLAGYCPGPALVSAGLGLYPALIFVPAMLLGAWLAGRLPGIRHREPR